jgi:hypothetical protein
MSRYLPDVLRKCSLEKFDIMHVVLNATYNWVNEFDTNKVEIKTEYRELMGDLFGIFANCGIKRTIILTTPIFASFFRSNLSHFNVFRNRVSRTLLIICTKKFISKC